jgi:hypothetical protein
MSTNLRSSEGDEWGKSEIYTEFWWGKMKERDKLEDLGLGGRLILNGSSRIRNGGCGLD